MKCNFTLFTREYFGPYHLEIVHRFCHISLINIEEISFVNSGLISGILRLNCLEAVRKIDGERSMEKDQCGFK